MSTKKQKNTYDDTKKMLNVIRKIQSSTKPQYGMIEEQTVAEPPDTEEGHQEYLQKSDQLKSFDDNPTQEPTQPPTQDSTIKDVPGEEGGNFDFVQDPTIRDASGEEGSDYAIINDVEVVIHSEDPEDLELNDEEKGNISQLIDDFRAEVIETVEFDKLDVYETSAKLGGKIGEIGLMFTLSTGDDTGLYINGQMLKIDENSLMILEKLGRYQLKFSSTINDLLVRRRST